MPDLTSHLPHWLWPGDDRPPEEIDDEIAEELRFHVDMLAEECEREGVVAESAQKQAAERFGDFDQILRRCRREKQGDIPMLKRIQATLTGLLAAAVVFIGWQQWAMSTRAEATWHVMNGISGRLSDISDRLHLIEPVPTEAPTSTYTAVREGGAKSMLVPGDTYLGPNGADMTWRGKKLDLLTFGSQVSTTTSVADLQVAKKESRGDVTGVVTGAGGEPIEGADVLLILKDWPNNRYRQRDKALKTDAEGRFTMKRAVPLDGQYGINAAIVAPGHAIASRYVLAEQPGGAAPESIDFQLTGSEEFRLRVTDGDGEPLAKALVAPASRKDAKNTKHLLYHQGSNPTWRKTDAEGGVTIDWFAQGDDRNVRVRPRGGDWSEHRLEATESAGDVTLMLK